MAVKVTYPTTQESQCWPRGQESDALIAELLRELHARGFRQYLFEWTQAADWLLADFVNEGGLMPEWTPPYDIGGAAIKAIRDFNRTLPESDRIQVHAIDVQLPDYGGAESWLFILGLVAQQLPDPGPIAAFLQGDHDTYESPAAAGSVVVLDVAAAHIAAVPGSGVTDYNLAASPENELFRVMNRTWPDQVVFLPLDDPLFGSGRIAINASGEIYVGAPKRHFDAVVLLPSAQRDFVGD